MSSQENDGQTTQETSSGQLDNSDAADVVDISYPPSRSAPAAMLTLHRLPPGKQTSDQEGSSKLSTPSHEDSSTTSTEDAAAVALPPSPTIPRPQAAVSPDATLPAATAGSTAPDASDAPTAESGAESILTPALQTRLGLFRRLQVGILQLKSRSRYILLFQGAFTLAQIGTFITMLVLSRSRADCSKPLRPYLAIHLVRVAIGYPLSFYNALAPPSRPPRGQQDTPELRLRREARRVMGNPRLDARVRSLADFISAFSLVWFCLGNFWVYSDVSTCKTNNPYLWWSSLATLIISYLRVAEVLAIVLAVVFFLPAVIFGLRYFGGVEKKHEIGPLSKEDIAKLPVVYYIPAPATDAQPEAAASATESVIGAEPAESPIPADATDAAGGGLSRTTNGQIVDGLGPSGKTPIRADRDVEKGMEPKKPTAPDVSSNNVASQPRRRNGRLLRLFFKRSRHTSGHSPTSPVTSSQYGSYISTPYPLHPLPDNLSSCPICLCDYEPPPLLSDCPDLEEQKKARKELEELTLLGCRHAIHRECLGPWLATSGRCPVCQQPVEIKQGDNAKNGKRGRRRTRAGTRAAESEMSAAPTAAP